MTNVTYYVERPKHLPDFADPPLDEVVLGVQFEPIPDFASVHAYPIWELFRGNYPTAKERVLLDPKFETFGGFNPRGNIELKVGSPPVGSRHWFISADKTHLLQFQANRFLINWRKRPDSEYYPRFENIAAEFNRNLLALSNHFRRELSYEININQAEVTYINVIPAKSFGEAGEWFSIWKSDPIEIEVLNASFSEICRNENGKPFARLYHEVQCGQKSDGTRAFKYSLDFRGKPSGSDVPTAMQFLQAGRELIVMRFDQLTTESAHTHWRKVE